MNYWQRSNRMEGDMAKDKTRTGIPGVPGASKVVNESAWGAAKAVERYGDSKYYMGRGAPPPKDMSQPQDPMDKPADKTFNDVPVNSWLRGGAPMPRNRK
jgi:hypothetical protein